MLYSLALTFNTNPPPETNFFEATGLEQTRAEQHVFHLIDQVNRAIVEILNRSVGVTLIGHLTFASKQTEPGGGWDDAKRVN